MQYANFLSIGGGLIGLSAAYYFLQQNPGKRAIVLEKEADIAQHQSAHNAGVLHSGVLWPTNSQKAYHVRYGKGMLRSFCDAEEIEYATYGAVIVASDSAELPQLDALYRQGIANGVDCELINLNQLRDFEPHSSGVAAIYIEEAGVVDYPSVARRLALRIEMLGGEVKTGCKVLGLMERAEAVVVKTDQGDFIAQQVVNAAGLHADRLAHNLGVAEQIKAIPFRGEYFQLTPAATSLVHGQIFPVPSPDLPFTGIHLTRTLDGNVLCGPNAILAGSREGYRRGQFNLRDTLDQATSRRVRRLTRQNFATALWEQRRSWSKDLFALTLQRLVPAIQPEHLVRAPAGVSPYAVAPDGTLSDDFVVERTARTVHVLSAPTPGATACLSFGRFLATPAP